MLITGIVALAKNTPTWLRLRNRKTAAVVTAVSAVAFLITGSLSSVMLGQSPTGPVAVQSDAPSAAPTATPDATATTSPARTSVPSPTPIPTGDPDDDLAPVEFSGSMSTVADTSATSGHTALAVLANIPVKGRAAKTGYDRDEFGQRWLDIDRNGCDTRNDILAAQLTETVLEGSCKVVSGVLSDPFTDTEIEFIRGQGTSELVQIDHVVALSDAWQKGAQQLTADQRATFANDPLNLLAVDGSANAQKGEGDAATWMPMNKGFRCEYVARQVAVKATYGLWVTQAEHDAIADILGGCPDEPTPTSAFATLAPVSVEPVPAPIEPEPVPLEPAPVPFEPAPVPALPAPVPFAPAPAPPASAPPTNVFYQNCDAVRAAGAAPIRAGDPGYSRKLDRDGDGVGCE